ncbi:DUF397 domain-containing protein [Streptomyces hoynatensis]|uniref:DUF397 domain-containing protein n=1 Tax=Streptomyces hoynatensis TaxID=1141874 RepID=A0A3A9YNN5_9ACTN|nr:DUF397 domain-containing protein [Streptomyces hoynatensis]RKN37778.1 DUF397 domain-containing protein [Streptomyces hoynatensis]
MTIARGSTGTWTKSTYSAGSGACVEVMSPARHRLAVRDSKVPAGPRLAFSAGSWSVFLAALPPGGGQGSR